MVKKEYKIILLVVSVILIGLTAFYFSTKEEKVHTLKSYDPVTKKTNVLQYVIREGDTIIHGKSVYYNQKGKKIRENNYVNGEVSGQSLTYYDNGNIESEHYMKNSKTRMEATWNYPDGNIERYILYDDLGDAAFLIFFDKQGNVKKYDGLPLIEIYQYKLAHKKQFKIKTNQHLKVGDTLKYKYLLANIPKTEREFKVELVGSENTKIKRTMTKVPPVQIDIAEVITKKGINTIRAIVQYKFNDREKTIINDTISIDVMVN